MLLWIFLFVFAGSAVSPTFGQTTPFLDESKLSTLVADTVENSLKYTEMQNHMDSLSYSSQTLNGEALLSELSNTLGTKFQSRIASVRSLRNAVVAAYGGSSNNEQCCSLTTTLTQDSRFKQPVSTNHVCERVSSSASSAASRLSELFLSTCIQNLENTPAMKWQYFGSEQGVTTLFPAAQFTDCGSYDNRFRPWYVQANVPMPKQVVIVIDTSGSMSQTDANGVSYISLARDAAKTVINTLNPNDQFAVVTFSTTAVVFTEPSLTNGNCYSSNFAQATPQNIARVEAFVDAVQAGGATQYGRALEAAFEYFTNNQASRNQDRVILFMSDGEPTGSNAVGQLNSLNGQVNNSVVVLTYGMGSADFSVLQSMAAATSTEVGTDEKPGIFTQITTPANLRSEMASYYNFFSVSQQGVTDPIWTVPYVDAFGLGIMITASLPVYSSNSLIGVVGVDLTIEELLAEASFFNPTETSYTFVTNSDGMVINHPNFPYITSTDPLFVAATAFERDDNFLTIFDSMKRGESGNKTFVSTKVLPQGDSTMYGVREVRVRSTYYWKQIPGTNFSLCLVLIEEDVQKLLQDQGPLSRGNFLYHRFDLVPPAQGCQHANNYGALGVSSIALAARSFQDPELYLSTEETATTVRSIVDYMEGASTTNPNIKDGVRNMVVATFAADQLWNNPSDAELNKRVLWRYIGTSNGMFRSFPGAQWPSNFDPVVRGWYEHAHAQRDKYVVTPPYVDAASGTGVVTLARALYEGKPGGNHDPTTDVLIGAMGVDIVGSYFYTLLQQQYSQCGDGTYKCIVIDQGGFVIVAEEFRDNSMETNMHIVKLEPAVADDLISSNVMQTKTCSNTVNGLVQRTYFIQSTQTLYSSVTHGTDCKAFQLIPISNTNTFLLAIQTSRSSLCTAAAPTCECPTASTATGAIAEPTCPPSGTCTCPCTEHNTAFQPCSNTYTFLSPQPCTRETPDLTEVRTPTSVDVSSLPVCYEIDFNTESGSPVGLIVGCVIGGLAAIFAMSMVVVKHNKKASCARAQGQNTSQPQPPPPPPPPPQPVTITQPSAPMYSRTYAQEASYDYPPSYSPPPYSA